MSGIPLLSPEPYLQAREQQRRIQLDWFAKREALLKKAETDATVRLAITALCQEDPVTFFQYFLCTYDPRPESSRKNVPFIPYDYQVDMLYWLRDSIRATQGTTERKNLLVEKSRDMGASWTILGFFLWSWLFENNSFLIISRKEEEVDKRGDMDTPFEKIRYMFYELPKWLRPSGFVEREHDKYMLFINPEGGDIVGESANAHAGRGGRKTAVLFDEQQAMGNDEPAYRACAQTTNVRISIGTPNGPVGKYYRLANGKDEEEVDKKRLHWSLHPEKGAGLIYVDGKAISPWYQSQCKTMSAEDVAAELDISYATSVKGLIFPEYTDLSRWHPPQVQIQNVTLNFGEEYAPFLRVWDPGLCFANLFMQKDANNRALAHKTNITWDANIHDVAQQVQELTDWFDRKLKPKRWDDCGDPAGASRQNSAQEAPEYITLRDQYGFDVDYTFMQTMSSKLRVKSRIAAIKNLLHRVCHRTRTSFLVVNTKECADLDEALKEKYRWKVDKRTKEPKEGQVQEEHPEEDVVDCLGYGVVYWWGVAPIPGQKKNSEQYQPPPNEIEWNYY